MSRESREKRRLLREQLKRRRAAVKAQLDEKRRKLNKKKPRRKRRWLIVPLLLLLLLLLMQNCTCSKAVGPEAPKSGPGGEGEAEEVEPVPREATVTDRIARQSRPDYETTVPEALPWIAAFRMQVAARSPRLAACFVGTERPGALRWTSAVEPVEGVVSAHTLEPVLQSAELTRQQRECVLGVLSEPAYRLQSDGERSTPTRVGIVIEF